MKKINFETIRGIWPVGLVAFICSISILTYSWFQVSPWTFRLFTKVCDSNGGSGCMVFYWTQTSFYWSVFKIFASLSVVFGLGTVFLIIKNKNEKNKKRKS